MKRDIRDVKKDSIWANIALMILYPYSFLTALTMMQGVHIIYPGFVISIAVLIWMGFTCKEKIYRRFIRLIGLVLVFLVLNMLLVGNSDIKNIVYGVFILPSIGALLFFYKVRYWIALLLFYSVAVFLGIYIIQNGPFVTEETELLTNSRNYVSYFVVLYSFPYFIHCYDYDKTPSLLVPVLCVFIAVFAIGRSGILVSLGLLFGVLYLKMMQKGRIRILYRFALLSLLVFALVVGVGGDFFEIYFSRFSEEGMSSAGRMPAWSEYLLSMLNPIHFFLGVPIESLQYTTKNLGGSLHNSYFTLHAREGIMGLVLIVYMFKGVLKLYKGKCYSILFVILVLLFKGLTDADMGGTYSGGDIYVFFLALVYLYYKDYKHERKSISIIPSSVPSDSRE